ncbi:phosphoethanolamine transferase EptA [mine drainage metagenome]|uniref:Phosphoethanolamine transferase EptA n=1 Tax=mine drainage metagenome TaxID=410659 RepID=A0A1J5RL17_9ZZZZ
MKYSMSVARLSGINLNISAPALLWLCSIYIVLTDNQYFWHALLKLVDISTLSGILFSLSIFAILTSVFSFIFHAFSTKVLLKPVLILMLILAAGVGYFQTNYGVIIDKSMIQNVVETDYKEASELISFSLLFHLALYGLLPALVVGLVKVRYQSFIKESLIRVLSLLGAAFLAGFLIWANYKNFVLIGREHRELRLFVNPTAPLYEAYKFTKNKYFKSVEGPIQAIGLDAHQSPQYLQARKIDGKKTIVVLVVGETARAKDFSLNGYVRETNPELSKDDVVSFNNTYSCGTSTAESVPCIFSHFDRVDYSSSDAGHYENLLDVLSHSGVDVLWRDNNSGCKGVCDRVAYEDVSNLPVPTLCNTSECFDEVLLHQLQEKIQKSSTDILLVLHQKGSHGPAYFKRYPEAFRRFTPECTDSAPQNCQKETLLNAYDNSILYTDHFLHQTIAFLKSMSGQYNAVMLYASDHGESLGENGLYLHGLPYALSPDEQRHIPMIAWVSNGYATSFGLDPQCLKKQVSQAYSHDNIFHSMLGLFGVETSQYKKDHDIFRQCIVSMKSK